MKAPAYVQISSLSAILLLVGCFTTGLTTSDAAPPSVHPLLPGKWPVSTWPRGDAYDVKVVGNYAYVALGEGGGRD